MFHHLPTHIIFYALQLFWGIRQVDACYTPLMAFAQIMNVSDCIPIMELKQKYGDDMPTAQSKFVRDSYVNVEKQLVCCDLTMNVTADFEHVGTALLRNYAHSCGDNVKKRISFAVETTFLSYPWSALLVYDAAERFQCGATLITDQYVLTAAHCIKYPYPLVAVRLREHNITSDVDCEVDFGGFTVCSAAIIEVAIEKTIVHPKYSTVNFNNDIALIRLAKPIRFDRSVRPICLPEYHNQEFTKPYGTITGWGTTENGTQSEVLLEADIPIRDISYYQNVYRRKVFDNNKICAGGHNAIEVCKGDSGGPLFLRMETDGEHKFRYMQAGITSLGARSCGDTRNYPAVFTKISTYMDWIADSIEFY